MSVGPAWGCRGSAFLKTAGVLGVWKMLVLHSLFPLSPLPALGTTLFSYFHWIIGLFRPGLQRRGEGKRGSGIWYRLVLLVFDGVCGVHSLGQRGSQVHAPKAEDWPPGGRWSALRKPRSRPGGRTSENRSTGGKVRG